jgi:hypothetical protein
VTRRATVLGEDGKAALVGLPWSIVGTGDFNFEPPSGPASQGTGSVVH